MDILEKIYEALYQCNKCGFCQATCTTYRNVWDEKYTARGRIRLILAVADGDLERTPEYEEAINTCLTCHQCAVTCPSGVKGDELILAARQDLFEKKGLPFIKKIPLQRVLPSRSARNMAFGAFRIFKGIMPSSFKGVDIKGMPVAAKSFTSSTVEVHKPVGETKARVAYFVGCMTDHTLPGVAEAVVKVLNANGVEVVVPKAQNCCGLPMYTYGDLGTAKKLAKENMDVIDKYQVDGVITSCGSCGGMLVKYGELFKDDPEAKQAEDFSAKTYDIAEYLIEQIELDTEKLGNLPIKITYHDSCHLARGMNVVKQPRELMKRIPGVELVEMKEADQCCGAAGLFQGLYPELSTQITGNKIQNAKATGAEFVAVDCPACLHRIQGGINQNKTGQKVAHIAEVLAAAYDKNDKLDLVR